MDYLVSKAYRELFRLRENVNDLRIKPDPPTPPPKPINKFYLFKNESIIYEQEIEDEILSISINLSSKIINEDKIFVMQLINDVEHYYKITSIEDDFIISNNINNCINIGELNGNVKIEFVCVDEYEDVMITSNGILEIIQIDENKIGFHLSNTIKNDITYYTIDTQSLANSNDYKIVDKIIQDEYGYLGIVKSQENDVFEDFYSEQNKNVMKTIQITNQTALMQYMPIIYFSYSNKTTFSFNRLKSTCGTFIARLYNKYYKFINQDINKDNNFIVWTSGFSVEKMSKYGKFYNKFTTMLNNIAFTCCGELQDVGYVLMDINNVNYYVYENNILVASYPLLHRFVNIYDVEICYEEEIIDEETGEKRIEEKRASLQSLDCLTRDLLLKGNIFDTFIHNVKCDEDFDMNAIMYYDDFVYNIHTSSNDLINNTAKISNNFIYGKCNGHKIQITNINGCDTLMKDGNVYCYPMLSAFTPFSFDFDVMDNDVQPIKIEKALTVMVYTLNDNRSGYISDTPVCHRYEYEEGMYVKLDDFDLGMQHVKVYYYDHNVSINTSDVYYYIETIKTTESIENNEMKKEYTKDSNYYKNGMVNYNFIRPMKDADIDKEEYEQYRHITVLFSVNLTSTTTSRIYKNVYSSNFNNTSITDISEDKIVKEITFNQRRLRHRINKINVEPVKIGEEYEFEEVF